MIDERELTGLLTEAAEVFDVPADGPQRILDAAEDHGPRRRGVHVDPWWRRHRILVAAAVCIVVVGTAAVVGAVRQEQQRPKIAIGHGQSSNEFGAEAGVAGSMGSAGGAGGAAVGGGATGGALAAPPATATAAPGTEVRPLADAVKVVKTGSAQVEVRHGAVGPTMSRLTTLVTGVSGYVAETKTSEGDRPSGTATVRVPANAFEGIVAEVRKLGTVKSVETHGQDVTAQYSDIQARLTALNATRDQLLTILRRATAIGDVLSVQDRINQVQTQIEQLQGQQKLLDDQTSYASLTVAVVEEGATVGAPDKPSGLAKAWDDARHGFTSGIETILAGSGTALVLLLVAVALFVLGRWGWVVLRRRLV